MENQNNNNNDNNIMGGKMMWMMMLCCIAPLVFILLSGAIASRGNWVAIAITAVFAVGYLILMNRMHRSQNNNSNQNSSKNNFHKSHGGGCH